MRTFPTTTIYLHALCAQLLPPALTRSVFTIGYVPGQHQLSCDDIHVDTPLLILNHTLVSSGSSSLENLAKPALYQSHTPPLSTNGLLPQQMVSPFDEQPSPSTNGERPPPLTNDPLPPSTNGERPPLSMKCLLRTTSPFNERSPPSTNGPLPPTTKGEIHREPLHELRGEHVLLKLRCGI